MKLAWWMWRRRMGHRLKLWWDLLTLIIDIWVLLYMIIPALIFVGWYYAAWLRQLPVWFQPEYLAAVPWLLGIIMLIGSPRTYLCRADLVYIFPHQQSFRFLASAGKIVSTGLASLIFIAFWIGIYPFYLHVDQVTPVQWGYLGGALLFMRWSLLQLKWKIRAIIPSNFRYWLLTGVLGLAWIYTMGQSLFPLVSLSFWVAAVWIFLPFILSGLLRVSRWESVIADEEYQDLQLMRMFLGHAAQASLPAGRSGRARWWTGRLGIPFHPDYTLAYFFLKYLLRKRKVWMIYLQVYLFVLFIIGQNLSYEFRLLMLALALGALAMLTELLWREHAEDLFLRMLPLTWDHCRKSVTRVLLAVTLPLCLLPLIMVGPGLASWVTGVAGTIGLICLAAVLAGYLGLKLATRLNYSYNNEP